MRGFSRRSPLNARIYLFIKENRLNDDGEVQTRTHKVIFQKYDVIQLILTKVTQTRKSLPLEFKADVENGIIKDRNSLLLQ